MRLMTIMAHPDDAELWCGGTLSLHAAMGDAVRICSMSHTADSVRGTEAAAAARIIGCELEMFGLRDTALRDTDEAVALLRRSVVAFQPDTVITHWFDDVHPDHAAVFQIVLRALVQHATETPAFGAGLVKFPRVFCCDTYASVGLHGRFVPNHFVDITSVHANKVSATRAHASQPVPYFLDTVEKQCRAHGVVTATTFAEAFLHVPLFGDRDDGPPLGGLAAISTV